MILVLDQNATVYESGSVFVERLALPSEIKTIALQASEPLELGDHDRVVYVAQLNAGGYQYQLDLIRNNPGVDEWIIYAVDCDSSLIGVENFSIQLKNVPAKIGIYPDSKSAQAALARPAVRKDTCLLVGLTNDPLNDLKRLMMGYLPGWHLESMRTDGSGVCEAIENSSCARVVLVGLTAADFDGVDWPDSVKPLFVRIRQEDHIYDSLHPEQWKRCLREWIGEQGGGICDNRIFQVSTSYENWRLAIEAGSMSPASLLRDCRFAMWDRFGLPLPPQEYTEAAIMEFLNGFTACMEMAEQIRR